MIKALLLSVPCLAGCSGASLLLKGPVMAACEKASLQGCSDMADGVIAYVDGNKVEGKKKLISAAGDNSPDDIRKFAKQLRMLEDIPGAQKYTGPVVEVAKLLDKESGEGGGGGDEAEDKPKKRKDKGGDGGEDKGKDEPVADAPEPSSDRKQPPPLVAGMVTADTDPTRHKGGIVKPFGEAKKQCNVPLGTGTGSCVKALKGPLFVTDIHSSPGCAGDLFVYSGAIDADPSWLITGAPLVVHGSRLLIGDNESLIIGGRTATEGCTVLWSGFRPFKRSDGSPAPAQ